MRALVQRVQAAAVSIDGQIFSQIDKGLLVFLGVSQEDSKAEAEYILRKLPLLRIFSDAEHPINRSLNDVGGEILLVSQFTLYADTSKGNRPSFIHAAKPDHAEALYEYVYDGLKALGVSVKTGVFGADMQISLISDGPVTIILESKS